MTDPDDAALLAALRSALHLARPAGGAPFAFAVAVSGGGDSMALLHLAQRLLSETVHPESVSVPRASLHAVTVDHGLRPESATEAAQVAAFCAARGVTHKVLRWSDGPRPSGNLMDQARRARVALMSAWAREQGIPHILLGHTADDVAETFLMNLARAAGLEGLSGLRPQWQEGGVTWHRPLLHVSRDSLRTYLRRHAISWVDDPSNENPRFARARARQALNLLKPLGLSSDAVAQSARHLATARAGLQAALHAKIVAEVTEIAGSLQFVPQAFPPEMLRLCLLEAIHWMTGAAHSPRADQISRVITRLYAGEPGTIAGLRYRVRAGVATFSREARALSGPVSPGQIWDHRWHLTGPFTADHTIGALGPAGLALCSDWRAHAPRDSALASPAIWQGDQLIAAPLVQKNSDWAATVQPSFGMFVLRH